MIHTQPSLGAGRLVVIGLALAALVSCTQKAEQPATNPKACEQLGTRLCKGPEELVSTCKSSYDLLTPEVCTSALSKIKVSLQKLADKHKKCDELVSKLCTDLGAESAGCTMARDSSAELTGDRCEGMLGEYGEVLAEFKQQEEQNKPLSSEAQIKLTQGSGPSFGPADAKVTIVEFSDFQCPYCSRAAEVAQAVKAKYGDKVRFVFRQYPLSFHENAQVSAEASLAAHAQGKFWELHDKMFANQGKLDRSSLEAYAQEVGIEMTAFKQALDQQRYKAEVDAELQLGEEAAVDGTPTMFINGQRIGNPTSVSHVSGLIDSALAKAKS